MVGAGVSLWQYGATTRRALIVVSGNRRRDSWFPVVGILWLIFGGSGAVVLNPPQTQIYILLKIWSIIVFSKNKNNTF